MMETIKVLGLLLLVIATLTNGQEPVCTAAGYCQEGQLLQLLQVPSARDCLLECKRVDECNWFSFLSKSSNCLLFVDCPTLDETCDDCISGEKSCEEEDSEPFWHMIIGGYSYPFNDSTVELYNWLTGEQCTIEDIPIEVFQHAGTVIDGVPIFCGGQTSYHAQTKCFTYNRDTKTWQEFSNLPATAYKTPNAFVPNRGWHIFGGGKYKDELTKSQKLSNLESEWEEGIDLYNGLSMFEQCSVQLDDNTTVFFGTDVGNQGIVTLDWNTLTYTKQPINLSGNRRLGSCTLLKGKRGEPLVAIAGGQAKGMEVWNPADKFVETVTQELPPEVGAASGLESSQLVSIKLGSEALLYGGWKKTVKAGADVKNLHQPGIWKFRVSDLSWTKVGSMLHPRYQHVVLPVSGVSCP